MNDLDQLLETLSQVAWVLFAIYTVVVFARSIRNEGWLIALLRMLSARILLPALVPLGLTLLSAALVFVQPTQVAVVISYITPGGIRPQPLRSGLHLIVPILEREILYPISWQTYAMSVKASEEVKGADAAARGRNNDDSIRARTSDGQEIRLDISIIFRINFEQVVALHTDWQNRYIEDFVRPVIRGIVRTQVSQFKVKEVNSSARKDLEATLDRLLTAEFAAKGLIVDQVLLRDITFSAEYAAAIEQKQVALEGEERSIHEAQQMRNLAEGTRDQAQLVAEGEANALRLRIKAQSEADAQATLVRAQAQSEALQMIGAALAQNPNLITYEYVQKLSPNIQAMLLPSNAPLLLPMADLLNTNGSRAITNTISETAQSLLSTDSMTTGMTAVLSSTLPANFSDIGTSWPSTSTVETGR